MTVAGAERMRRSENRNVGMALSVAQYLVETLVHEGVERIYGVTGDSLNAITDAIHRDGRIKFVHVRHEEAAALMASAEAQATGKLAVCAGSCGPGNLHLINGLYDAHRSGAAVLAIASHIPSGQIGTGYFQETHPERLFTECSHYCEMAMSAAHAPRVLRGAIQHAVGRCGVGVMVLSGDLSSEEIPGDIHPTPIASPRPHVRPNDAEMTELAEVINGAKRVCIFGGYGCREAHDEVVALASRLKAPVGHTSRAKPHLEWGNPYDVGMNGLIGFGGFPAALEGCDLLLLLGCDFPYVDFYPKDAKIVQIDSRAEVLGRRTHVDLGLVGDVGATLRMLLPMLTAREDERYLEHAKSVDVRSKRKVSQYIDHVDPERPIHPELVAATLSELMADDSIVTADTGLCNVWLARHWAAGPKRDIIASWVHGTMANALPHAAGAQAAFPNRQVVAMAG
ncbi:ubiquinone-dependent pyruvate dehydrogenase, partial [bacterium]